MPAACHQNNNANCPADGHGNICCVHNVTGPSVGGSPNVFIHGQAALRIGDPGVHSACCGSNTWNNAAGSPNVYTNGIPSVRLGDTTTHCGGTGRMIEGSSSVFIN